MLLDLPDELLLAVLQQLDASLLLSLQRLSSRFYHLINSKCDQLRKFAHLEVLLIFDNADQSMPRFAALNSQRPIMTLLLYREHNSEKNNELKLDNGQVFKFQRTPSNYNQVVFFDLTKENFSYLNCFLPFICRHMNLVKLGFGDLLYEEMIQICGHLPKTTSRIWIQRTKFESGFERDVVETLKKFPKADRLEIRCTLPLDKLLFEEPRIQNLRAFYAVDFFKDRTTEIFDDNLLLKQRWTEFSVGRSRITVLGLEKFLEEWKEGKRDIHYVFIPAVEGFDPETWNLSRRGNRLKVDFSSVSLCFRDYNLFCR